MSIRWGCNGTGTPIATERWEESPLAHAVTMGRHNRAEERYGGCSSRIDSESVRLAIGPVSVRLRNGKGWSREAGQEIGRTENLDTIFFRELVGGRINVVTTRVGSSD